MAMNTVAYERGRNDRRMNLKKNPFRKMAGEYEWESGWHLQDAIFKKDTEYAYKRGRKDATEGNNTPPYPVGTHAYNQWVRGHSEVVESRRKAAEEKAAKAAAEKVAS